MASSPKSIDAILYEAVDIESPVERAEYLNQACGSDAELRRRVDILVADHFKAGDFLERPAVAPAATVDSPPINEQPGTNIGSYKLLQQLGEGGMGVVYMAEQTKPVERRVALKIIKPGMDSRQVIARFEAERQALALMDHPNIAKVLDAAATDSGRPYFVMELVRGVPITQYCDQQHLTPNERLELFIPICQAVQHAHQKGIIHRDLKPSNVLVALYDGEPVPKVIDFGVAKATSQKLTEKTMFTQYGQVIGTLEYMSPEQAQVNQLDIDTRSDIYSLGVLLYELLTGVTPFDRTRLRSAALDELMRIIREEEPPRPSLRLSTIDTLASVAANRRIEPKRLRGLVRGELDWIVMKAMEKDCARRYEAANGFAADVQRYLDDEPVVACPPSRGYKLRKFARRNKMMLMTASMIAAAVLFGLVGTTWQAIRATRAERIAELERDSAQRERDRAISAEETARVEQTRATKEAGRANEQVRISTAMRLAVQSQAVWEELPVQGVLLAVEAVESTRRHDGTTLRVAHETMLSTASNLGGLPLVGHRDRVKSVAITPSGRWLATASNDKTARLWDLTARDIASSSLELSGHEDWVTNVAITPNGRWLATTSLDSTARLWDLTAPDSTSAPLVLRGHEAEIVRLAISPDSHWLVTGCHDGTAGLWDLTTRDIASSYVELIGHEDWLLSLAISHDSRWLITGSQDTTARVWDLTAADPVASSIVLEEHVDHVDSVAISPDSRWALTQSRDGTARLWDLSTEIPVSSSKVLKSSFAISSNSRWLLTQSGDGTARLWDLSVNDLDRIWDVANSAEESLGSSLFLGQTDNISRITVSPDGRWLVTGGYSSVARLWDLTTGDPGNSSIALRGHDDVINAFAIGPNSRWLVTGSFDGTARLWDLASESPASDLVLPGVKGTGGGRRLVAISPDGGWLATAANDGSARLWKLNSTGQDLVTSSVALGEADDDISLVAFSPNSDWLVTGSEDGTARLWDLTKLTEPARVFAAQNEGRILAAAISPDNRWLAIGNYGESASLWDLTDTEALPRALPGYRALQFSNSPIVISPNGRWLVTASERPDKKARLWDLMAPDPTDSPIELIGHEMGISSLTIGPESRWLVTSAGDDTARIWDLHEENPRASPVVLRGHSYPVMSTAVSPDGRWLVTTSFDSTARLWNLTAADPVSTCIELLGHTAALRHVAISPNSRWVVTGGGDGTPRVWDLTAEDPATSALVLRGHAKSVSALAFSRDSRWVITGNVDGTVRLWDLNVDSLLQRARRLVGRELRADERQQYMIDGL